MISQKYSCSFVALLAGVIAELIGIGIVLTWVAISRCSSVLSLLL
jgi:hypothetical protein